jgi:hypothetical protein
MERVHVQRRALLVGAALGSLGIEAQAHTSPTTPLFVIARSKNANVVHYEAHVAAKGALDREHPILAYWLMRAEDGRREGLTWLEERLAYGWSASFDARGELLIRLRAFSRREIRVFRRETGSFRALARIAGQRALLERIYVASDGGGLTPNVRYVDLFGTTFDDGRHITERIVPG